MDDRDLLEIYDTMLHQQKLLLDVKVQVESLKAMMFEHRPAFVESFKEQENKISATEPIQRFQAQIEELERNLEKIR